MTYPDSIHYAAFTHAGKSYYQNQDAILLPEGVQQQAGFWHKQLPLDRCWRFAIADGAGGLPCADKASRLLLRELQQLDVDKPDLLPRSRLLPLHQRFRLEHRIVRASKSADTPQCSASAST